MQFYREVPLLLGPKNALVTCLFCNVPVRTTIKLTTTTRTHITAILFTLVCCCCCIPYWCVDSAKNTDHYCPKCYRYLGTYER
ncbi:unnamed protein product [Colias eurytheme]|nr:unnamed protein product [Colias eurytheme]